MKEGQKGRFCNGHRFFVVMPRSPFAHWQADDTIVISQ